MIQISALESLVNRGLIQSGTSIGVKTNSSQRIYHRFQIQKILTTPELVFEVLHLQSNRTIKIEPDLVMEIDGMDVSRFLNQADLNEDGSPINKGKKRGRRAKVLNR